MDEAEREQNPFTIATLDPEDPDIVWTGSWRLWRTVDGGEKWSPKRTPSMAPGSPRSRSPARWSTPGRPRAASSQLRWRRNVGRRISGPDMPARMLRASKLTPGVFSQGSGDAGRYGPDCYLRAGHRDQGGGICFERSRSGVPSLLFGGRRIELEKDGERPGGRAFQPRSSSASRRIPCTAPTTAESGRRRIFDEWTDITGDMPNVIISDLVLHHKTRLLFAATYGRGIWRLPLLA